MADFISASHDVVFKALFVYHEDILKAFLHDVLGLPVTENTQIDILNPELIPDSSDGKMSRLDLHVHMPYRRLNVEMQARKRGFSEERVLYYWAEMFVDRFEAGQKYEELEQTYSINVLGFKFLDCDDYHSDYSILENKRHDSLTDKLSIHILELPKLPKKVDGNDNKQMWLRLIKADSEEALEMVRAATNNPTIHKAIDAVKALNADEVLREQIRQRDKALRDYENEMAIARSEGRALGIEEGRAEGRTEGEAIGEARGMISTLATLVKGGLLSIADAAKTANMDIEEFKIQSGLS